MCQTAIISNRMVRMSRRAYTHRLEIVTPNTYRVNQLVRLNRDLDALYELVFSQWRSITAADYRVFGGQFKLLLETIASTIHAGRLPKEAGLYEEAKRLGMNYSALYELNSDIVNFGINAPNNTKIQQAFARLEEVDNNSHYHD